MILISPMDVIFFFNIKAGGDRMTNEENKNDLTEKFMSSEVV
jgi:hypothetical protein